MRLGFSILITAVFLFIVQVCNAQQLQLSPEEYMGANQRYLKILGSVDDKTVCFIENEEGYRILWYDSAMRKVATSKLDFLDRSADNLRFHIKSGAIQVFYQRKKRKQRMLWAAKVVPLHKDTIVPVLIDSIELRGAWDKQRFDIYGANHPIRTVYSKYNYDNKNDLLTFEATSLNADLDLVQRVNGSVNDVSFHALINVSVDNQDGLHLFFGEPSRQTGKWSKILVGSKSTNQGTVEFKNLDLENRLLGEPKFVPSDKTNRMHIAGLLYTNTNQAANYLGHFAYNLSSQNWQKPMLTDVSELNQDKSNNLNDVRLRNFLLKEDGGCAFILENSYEEVHQRNRNMGMMTGGISLGGGSYSVYHDDEIHAINLSANGAIEWHEVVLKSQESSDANGSLQSFGMLEYPMGNVFLFNDQQNRSNRFITAFLSNKGQLNLRQFSSSLYQNMEQDNILLRRAKQVAINEIVFPVIKRGALSFAKIIF